MSPSFRLSKSICGGDGGGGGGGCEDAVEKKIRMNFYRSLLLYPRRRRRLCVHLATASRAEHSAPSSHCEYIKYTHHFVNQLGYGHNEGPDPFPKRLRVDGAGGCADDGAPRALLWVYF